jgi:hypothetical protein
MSIACAIFENGNHVSRFCLIIFVCVFVFISLFINPDAGLCRHVGLLYCLFYRKLCHIPVICITTFFTLQFSAARFFFHYALTYETSYQSQN